MKSFTPKTLMSMTLLLTTYQVFAEPIAAPIPADTSQMNATTDKGCYRIAQPLEDQGPYTFQTTGWCQKVCVGLDKAVMALYKGTNCYCGNLLPPASQKTTSDNCQEPCVGFPGVMCGGKKAFGVFLTGLVDDADVQTYTGTITATDAATTSGPSPSVVTQAGQTIIVTTGSSPNAGGGPNKAGIAAGVVVGVIAIGAIIGGVFFFFKYKKRKAVEEEYRRNATISSFVAGGKSQQTGSMSDSRLDPSIMSHRRQSTGSIADDQDFSRRILKVTNPDGHY